MPRFAANLTLLYNDQPFLDRFEAAARDGFQAVEYLFPYAWSAEVLAERLKACGLTQALFNAPPGDWEAGERGLACLPGREGEFREGIARALAYAVALGCARLHVMAGLTPAGMAPGDVRDVYVSNLRHAADAAARVGVRVQIEPINTRDMPGYFLSRQDEAHTLLDEIDRANVQVQMDLYHAQIVEGDLATKLRRWLPTGRVGHLQVAGVPERHEPDVGELHYPYLFELIDALGYEGWIGCEYRPQRGGQPGATSAGLGWMRRWQGDRPGP